MDTSNINLDKPYFEYKVFTKIMVELTFDKLHEIFRQLKANTTAVPCTLGGGVSGYLGMHISVSQYATVAPSTPFVRPPMPGALVIDSDMTQYQIAIFKI